MKFFSLSAYEKNQNTQTLFEEVAALLKQEKILALPTETVYGLSGLATSDKAIQSIYKAKGRPSSNPLIIHVDSLKMAEKYAIFNEDARRLAEHFWPGSLTLICPLKMPSALSSFCLNAHNTVALRCPQGIMRDVITKLHAPLAAPSANRSGHVSATSSQHVQNDLSDSIDGLVDGGISKEGLESTILNVTEDSQIKIMRYGALSIETIQNLMPDLSFEDCSIGADPQQNLEAPGMMCSHYAPHAPVIMNVKTVEEGQALLVFGTPLPPNIGLDTPLYTISAKGDLKEAAYHLYEGLRSLDQLNPTSIGVMPIPNNDIGMALNDRLKRASAPKPLE